MKGHELGRKRTELGVSLEELAKDTDLDADTLAQIELYDLRLTREDAELVKLGFWSIQHGRVMAASGLPECEWINKLLSETEQPDLRLVEKHTRTCEVCRAREDYARQHAPRMPGAQGWIFAVFDAVRQLSPPLGAMLTGVFIVLAVTGIPIIIAIASGIVRRDVDQIGDAGSALGMIAGGGAAGGLAHLLTAGLRARNTFGFYASWILTTYAFMAGLGLLAIAVGQQDAQWLMHEPAAAPFILAFGAAIGLVIGKQARQDDPNVEAMDPATAWKHNRRAIAVFVAVVVLTSGGLFGWSKYTAPQRISSSMDAEQAARQLPDLEQEVRARPDDPAAQYKLGLALGLLDRNEEAIEPLEHAIRLVPDNPFFQNAYGWSLLQLGRFEDAVVPLEKAAAREPDYLYAYVNLGITLANLGRMAEATRALEHALEIDRSDLYTHNLLAWAYLETGRFAEARVMIEPLLHAQPLNPMHKATAAQALLGLKRPDEALDMYREAARLAPDEIGYWRELARMAHLMKHYDEADAAFARVYQLAPQHFTDFPEDRRLRDEARQKSR